ncbi:MAG TPA: hypothetical protein VGI92_01000 [Gemmatimonadales bacterium]|jgi:hypothetical protein
MITEALLMTVASMVTVGVAWLVMPFFFNGLYRRSLVRRGYVLVKEPPRAAPIAAADATPTPAAAQAPAAAEQQDAVRAMAADVARLPVSANECMECGANGRMNEREFGFARIIDQKKEYGEAGAAAAASILSGLLGGPMMLKGPRTTTTANIIRSKLVFCEPCLGKRKNMLGLPKITDADYALHPWWGAAQQHGFITHLDSYQLAKYH